MVTDIRLYVNRFQVDYMKDKTIKNIALSAMLFAVGMVLPFITGQIPSVGKMLLPMHIPVMLCGLICGSKYGLTIGFLLPLVRSVVFSVPVMYPTAISMAFELAAYGFVLGFSFSRSKWKCIKSLYKCMLLSMLSGRAVLGVCEAVLLGFGKSSFTLSTFLMTAFVNAIPGILLQLIAVPAVMLVLGRTHLVHFHKRSGDKKDDKHRNAENKRNA